MLKLEHPTMWEYEKSLKPENLCFLLLVQLGCFSLGSRLFLSLELAKNPQCSSAGRFCVVEYEEC